MSNQPQKSNWRKLANGHYLVRSQAGFNHALKDFDPEQYMERGRAFTFPSKYPSVVSMRMYYIGSDHISTTCTPLNEYVQALKDLVVDLENE